MYKALYPINDVDWLFVSKKDGERVLTNIKDSAYISIQRLEDYMKKVHRKTDYSHQKQCKQHKYQQNKNNRKTKIGRSTTV